MLASLGFGFLWFALPIFGKRLGASALEIGALFSVFTLVTVLLRPLVGRALDRFGRKWFFVAGLACYAAAMATFAAVSSLGTLYIARIIQGIGASLLWLSAYTIATDRMPTEERGHAVGRVDEALARGALVGAFLGFALLSFLPGDQGWRWVFLVYAVAAALGAWQALVKTPETRPLKAAPGKRSELNLRALLRLMAIVFLAGISTAMITPLLLIFLQDKFTTDIATLAWAYVPAAVVASFLPSRLGRISDRFGRVAPMALGMVVSGAVSLLMPNLASMVWLVILWVVEAIGAAAAAPAQEAMVADLTGGDERGTGYGFFTFAASLGAVIGPLVGGWLYDNTGHAAPFYLNGLILFVAAGLAVLLLRRPRLPAAAPTLREN